MRRRRLCFVTTVPMAVSAFLRQHIERLSDDYDIYVISNYASVPLPQNEHATYLHVPLARKISPLTDLKTLVALAVLFRRYKFDGVQSVTPKAGLLGMMAARLTGVPVRIHWFTGQVWATRAGMARRLLKYFDQLIALLASQLLADSPSQRTFLVAEGVCRANRIDVIGEGSICGVDGERFRPNAEARARIRAAHNIPSDAQVVLFLGRLNRDKGLRELAEAMVLLDEQFPSLHWLVAGPDEGDMAAHIRAVAAKLGERLHFQDFTNEPEAYMAAADIFCLPSYREGFGSSALEAAAVGIPTIATRIYGLTDAVEDGRSGLLVHPADAAALAEALRKLLGDPKLCAEMGSFARKRALERFSSERIVNGLRDFYARVFSSPRP